MLLEYLYFFDASFSSLVFSLILQNWSEVTYTNTILGQSSGFSESSLKSGSMNTG